MTATIFTKLAVHARMRPNTSLDIHVLQYISSYLPDDVIFRFLWDPFHMTEKYSIQNLHGSLLIRIF